MTTIIQDIADKSGKTRVEIADATGLTRMGLYNKLKNPKTFTVNELILFGKDQMKTDNLFRKAIELKKSATSACLAIQEANHIYNPENDDYAWCKETKFYRLLFHPTGVDVENDSEHWFKSKKERHIGLGE